MLSQEKTRPNWQYLFESDVNKEWTHGDKDQAFKDMDNDRDYIYKYNDKGLDLPALRTYSLQHVIKAAEHTSTTAKKVITSTIN